MKKIKIHTHQSPLSEWNSIRSLTRQCVAHLSKALSCTLVSVKSIPNTARDPALFSSPDPNNSSAFLQSILLSSMVCSAWSGLECFAWFSSNSKSHIRRTTQCASYTSRAWYMNKISQSRNCSAYHHRAVLTHLQSCSVPFCIKHTKKPSLSQGVFKAVTWTFRNTQ